MKKIVLLVMFLLVIACSKDSENIAQTQAYVTLKQNNSAIEEYFGDTYHQNYLDSSTSYLTTSFFGFRFNSEADTSLKFTVLYGQGEPIVKYFQYIINSKQVANRKIFLEDENHIITWEISENSLDGFKATYSGKLINLNENKEIIVKGTVYIKYGHPYNRDPYPEI